MVETVIMIPDNQSNLEVSRLTRKRLEERMV